MKLYLSFPESSSVSIKGLAESVERLLVKGWIFVYTFSIGNCRKQQNSFAAFFRSSRVSNLGAVRKQEAISGKWTAESLQHKKSQTRKS